MKTFGNELQRRLIAFSCSVAEVTRLLPADQIGKYLSQQLLRSGMSPSLNYAEACSAESKADFIHKMRICLKELRETEVCLQMIDKLFDPRISTEILLAEADQLISIFVKSIQTSRLNMTGKKN